MHKTLEITLRHSDGAQKTLFITYPAGSFSIDVVVKPLLQICDAILELQLTATPVSCKAGCAHCCNQLIPLSGAEVIFLNNIVQSLPRARRRKISAAFRSIRDKSQRLIASSNGVQTGFDERYFNLGIACPFLEQGRCGIYEQRPLACREYHVDTPSSHCRNPYHTNTHRVAKGFNLGAMLTAFSGKMLQVDKMPIPLFLLDIWDKNERYANTVYDSLILLEALLNGIKTLAGNHPEFCVFEWRYVNTIPATATSRIKANGKSAPLASKFVPSDIIEPLDLPKRLVEYANAKNIGKVIDILMSIDENLAKADCFLEIGSGDGYFRYLASLTKEARVQRFSERIIETESDAHTVEKNRARGKETQLVNAKELVQHFGKAFTPLVISMNVLDIFPADELDSVLCNIAGILKPGGSVVHIMSSAIHSSVFQDIAATHTNKVLLPYVHNHYIGVTIVDRSAWSDSRFPHFSRDASLLAQLFKHSPEEYIRTAKLAMEKITDEDQPYGTLLLHEYSFKKIATRMRKTGFEVVHEQRLTSSKIRQLNDYHKAIGNANQITNHLGALLVDYSPVIPPNRVKEESTFGVIIARLPLPESGMTGTPKREEPRMDTDEHG